MKKIIVVDFGSQYNQLIVRRVRELGIYSELVNIKKAFDKIKNDKDVVGIIFSGGPDSVYLNNSLSIDKNIYQLHIPILGICYGMQLISHQLGGKVGNSTKREYGNTQININDCPLTKKIPSKTIVWMSHGDYVIKPPVGFKTYASSTTCNHIIIGDDKRKIYAVQFHPEVSHTTCGTTILENFIKNICGVKNKS